MIKKIFVYFFGCVMGLLCLFALLAIYKNIIGLLNPNKVVSYFGYTDYLISYDYNDEYNKGDVAFIKVNDVYRKGDYILYYYQNSLFFGKIDNVNGFKFSVDNHDISKENIIGNSVYKLNNFEGFYNFLISPIFIIIILITSGVYFYLTFTGKIRKEI